MYFCFDQLHCNKLSIHFVINQFLTSVHEAILPLVRNLFQKYLVLTLFLMDFSGGCGDVVKLTRVLPIFLLRRVGEAGLCDFIG